ncbi:GatB/YqeY domain-containing protein [Nocardioides sambongensis]|uniref:GatB/YqeY domain-containing protein n=1 Tax=Nocardioides sambongensis TaxID=2589074 RepID=UPI0018C88188|nr:GatB/YqeY domain-containing protein [Nocardioides sambongensis]
MSQLQARLREDLGTALRARDRATAGVLRTALAAIANAEAQPVPVGTSPMSTSEGPIAGAALGVGAAEVARRELSEADVQAVVARERDERLATAVELAAHGREAAAEQLRHEAALLGHYLDDAVQR